ncbi:Nn.00g025920.m01.CDS01 [Neocucurbitaria sp. VM-36]
MASTSEIEFWLPPALMLAEFKMEVEKGSNLVLWINGTSAVCLDYDLEKWLDPQRKSECEELLFHGVLRMWKFPDHIDHVYFARSNRPALPVRSLKENERVSAALKKKVGDQTIDWKLDVEVMKKILKCVDGGSRFLHGACDSGCKRQFLKKTCQIGNPNCESFDAFDHTVLFRTDGVAANTAACKAQMKAYLPELMLPVAVLDQVYPGQFPPPGFWEWERLNRPAPMPSSDST